MPLDVGSVYATITADTRPFTDELDDVRDRLTIQGGSVSIVAAASSASAERSAAYTRLYARGLRNAAEWWRTLARTRARLNPLRLLDAWHARACERQAQAMDPKEV